MYSLETLALDKTCGKSELLAIRTKECSEQPGIWLHLYLAHNSRESFKITKMKVRGSW